MNAAVFFLSAAVLAHEITLLRVLSMAYWHHAASLVVSVALLAFGVAGSLLALAPGLKRRGTVTVCAALYALMIPLSIRAAGAVDFNVLEVGWDSVQWLRLLALEGIFFLPFLCAALGIAVALASRADAPGRIYGANLLGSGAGSLASPLLLGAAPPVFALQVLGVVAALSAFLCANGRLRILAVAAAGGTLLLAGHDLPMSPFKSLPAAPNKRIIETRYGPLGRVDRAAVPSLHYAPGLSLMSPEHPRDQEGLFVDGHLVGARDLSDAAYLGHTVGELPFLLLEEPRTLLLGVGPGLARAAEVVEANADLLEAAQREGIVGEPRAFLEGTDERYDLIVLHVPALHAAAETPLLTVEGLRAAFDRTTPAGAVALSCDLITPPRAGLKLLATAEQLTPHLVAIRSADRLCVVLRRQAPTEADKRRVLEFCDQDGFDPVRPLAWRSPDPHHVTQTPLLPPDTDYPYDVRPATDARPYFFKFFRWSRISDLFDREATSFVQWPFVALMVAFLQVTLLGLLLMAAPLLWSARARAPAPLFFALGLGFMFMEMSFLQRGMVRLGNPVHAAAAVFGGFMVGAGLGSLAGERLGRPRRRAALAVILLAPFLYWAMPRSPVLAALSCAVLAFPMGIPFPAALSRVPSKSVPWALAWNGCASVAAAAAAPLVSSTFGIPATAGAAVLLYLFVAARGTP